MAWLIVALVLIFLFKRIWKRNYHRKNKSEVIENKGLLFTYFVLLTIMSVVMVYLGFIAISPKEIETDYRYLVPTMTRHFEDRKTPPKEYLLATSEDKRSSHKNTYFYTYETKGGYLKLVEVPKSKTNLVISKQYKQAFGEKRTRKYSPYLKIEKMRVKTNFWTHYVLLTDLLDLGNREYTFHLPPDKVYHNYHITHY